MEKHRITVFCIEYNKTAGEGAAVLKSFPQPLTAAEEKYYVQKYTEGDLEAKHILIERNLRLVAHIVKKYQPPPEEMEDLLSIGTIGLMKAVVTFDPEKSARLATYAARCIENELLMDVIRLYQKVESELSARERIVLKLRYGLYNEEEYTQREIAKMLGISRSYVSRIEKSAIEKLRAFFPS